MTFNLRHNLTQVFWLMNGIYFFQMSVFYDIFHLKGALTTLSEQVVIHRRLKFEMSSHIQNAVIRKV